MTLWAGYGQRVSLDALCKGMGIPTSKGDMDGSQVYDAWLAGEYDRIAAYNLQDVKATAEVWHRLNGGAR
jgi:predicted PolB exonuclease-like 3'-5' exonuclease